ARRWASAYDRMRSDAADGAAPSRAGAAARSPGRSATAGAGSRAAGWPGAGDSGAGSHSGRRVASTKSTASPMVTPWANSNQYFFNPQELLSAGPRKEGMSGMVGTPDLVRYLDELLGAAAMKDYCPNGMQVEGASVVSRAVFAVTASLAVVEQAAAAGAQALVVHHGWFWRGEDPRVVGTRRRRLAALLAADINLIGYHLPLDLHPELGNNAQLGQRMGWPVESTGGERGLIALASLPAPV